MKGYQETWICIRG